MEQFYQKIMEGKNYENSLSLKSMLNDLIEFRRDRIFNHFLNNYYPFDEIGRYLKFDTLFFGVRKL